MMKIIRVFIFLYFVGFLTEAFAGGDKKAAWIWYPGDMELWLHNEVVMKRQQKGEYYPPFWRMDSPYR